ncbi:cold-induced protein [Lactarius deliciosus]|nr:cold-induced protein [Lactarius deliciosus]
MPITSAKTGSAMSGLGSINLDASSAGATLAKPRRQPSACAPSLSSAQAVRGQTVRYNTKLRVGRGFTLGELKEAGVSRKTALGLGIVVDHRRRNLSVEGKAINVERLKAYKERLVVFPRKTGKPKKSDSSPEDLTTPTTRQTLPLPPPFVPEQPRKIGQEERAFNAYKTLRNYRAEARFEGARKIRAAKASH